MLITLIKKSHTNARVLLLLNIGYKYSVGKQLMRNFIQCGIRAALPRDIASQ